MKKLSILIALLVVAAFGFAQDVTIDGSATLTVGFDLDTNQFGFKNESSAELEVKWTFDDTEAGGSGAFIKLTDMDFTAEDDAVDIDDPDVEAGLIFAPITITIFSAPDMKFDNAEGFEFVPDDADDDGDDERNDVKPELVENNVATAAAASGAAEFVSVAAGAAAPTGALGGPFFSDADFDYYIVAPTTAATLATWQGLTISADLAPLTVDLWIATDGTWVQNTDNALAVGAVIGAAIDPLDLEVGVIYGPTDAADLGVTVGVDATLGPATVDIGFDLFIDDYDASVEIGLDLGVASLTSLTYLTSVGGAGLELFEEVVVDLALVDELTFVNTTQLETVLVGDFEWYNSTDLKYDLGGIEPFALVEVYDLGAAADLDLDLEVGVELTGQIELTTFTLKYGVDSLLGASNMGAVTFATKIEY